MFLDRGWLFCFLVLTKFHCNFFNLTPVNYRQQVMTYVTKQIDWNLKLNGPVRISTQWAENCKSKLLWPACFEVYSIDTRELNCHFALIEHLPKTDIFLELVLESFFCLFFSLQHRSLFVVKLFVWSIDRHSLLPLTFIRVFFFFLTTSRNDEHRLIRHYAKR